jgi:hypothetical protein
MMMVVVVVAENCCKRTAISDSCLIRGGHEGKRARATQHSMKGETPRTVSSPYYVGREHRAVPISRNIQLVEEEQREYHFIDNPGFFLYARDESKPYCRMRTRTNKVQEMGPPHLRSQR